MSLVLPTGVVSNVKERFRSTLADCQSIVDWSQRDVPKIYLDIVPGLPEGRDEFTRDELELLRPFVLIYTGPISYSLVAEPGSYSPSGSWSACFEQNTPTGDYTGEELDRIFDNFIGEVIREIREHAINSQNGWSYPTKITTEGPMRSSCEDAVAIGDCQRYWLHFEWGISQ